jgi:hypothetical protein
MKSIILSLILSASALIFWFLQGLHPTGVSKTACIVTAIIYGTLACWIVYSGLRYLVTKKRLIDYEEKII